MNNAVKAPISNGITTSSEVNELCKILDGFNNKPVSISIKGAITIPLNVESFEFINNNESIAFGERECEIFPFEIDNATIKDVEFLTGLDGEVFCVDLKVVDGGLLTHLNITNEEVV